MRTRSYVFALVLLALCVAAAVGMIQKAGLLELETETRAAETSAPPKAEDKASPTLAAKAGSAMAQARISSSEGIAAQPQGIDGLVLQLSRPLMFDIGEVYGIAVDDTWFYVGSSGAGDNSVAIYQARRCDLTYAQMRVLPQDVPCELGGLDVGSEYLVATLLREGESGTALLFIERQFLEVTRLVDISVRIGPVALGADNVIYAYGLDDNLYYTLDAEGRILNKIPRGVDTTYQSMAVSNGRLLCSGYDSTEDVAVIDIVEPRDFSLVTRHRVYLTTRSGASLTSHGFATYQGEFFFMPGGSPRPMVMTFALDRIAIEQFVP